MDAPQLTRPQSKLKIKRDKLGLFMPSMSLGLKNLSSIFVHFSQELQKGMKLTFLCVSKACGARPLSLLFKINDLMMDYLMVSSLF